MAAENVVREKDGAVSIRLLEWKQETETTTNDAGDEDGGDSDRHTWGSKREYILSVLGFSVGLGNILRFPYLCEKNGGGAFLIPFIIAVFLIAIPLFFLETVLGQFTARSPLHVWGFCPLIKGVGAAQTILSTLAFWYLNVVLAWPLYYFISSFTPSPLPWARCDGWWNTPLCTRSRGKPRGAPPRQDDVINVTSLFNASWYDDVVNVTSLLNASSSSTADWMGVDHLNSSSEGNSTKLVSAAEEFWQHNVLQASGDLFQMGHLVWYLVLCHLASHIFMFLALIKGIRTAGKVVYVTAIAPYIILTVLLIRGVSLPGAKEGIIYYIRPDFQRLQDPKVWVEAAIQVFYSLGAAWGPAITLASYNKFHNNCLRDSIILPLIGEGTSILCGFTIFSVLGYMSHESGLPISEVVSSGPGLGFIVYPEAISLMPLPQLWAVLFFAMLFTAAVDTQLGVGESVLTSLFDHFPRTLPRRRTLVTAVIIVTVLLTSLPFVTQAGVYWYQLVDWFIATYTLTVIAILEVVCIAWVYGADRFGEDIQMMIGRKPPMIIKLIWCFLNPLILMALLVITLMLYAPPVYGDYHYDTWATVIGWIIATISFLPIPAVALLMLYRAQGSILQRLKATTRPDDNWGPADRSRRQSYHQHMLKREPRQSCLDIIRN